MTSALQKFCLTKVFIKRHDIEKNLHCLIPSEIIRLISCYIFLLPRFDKVNSNSCSYNACIENDGLTLSFINKSNKKYNRYHLSYGNSFLMKANTGTYEYKPTIKF